MLPQYRDRDEQSVAHEATLTDYMHVAIRVMPGLAIAATPFLAFGFGEACGSHRSDSECGAINAAALGHVAVQVLWLVVGWTIGRRHYRRWPVWAVAALSGVSAITFISYAAAVG